MAIGVLNPSAQFVKWSRDGQFFIAHNANQTDASATMFSGVVSSDSAVMAHLMLGFDWTSASSPSDAYRFRVYLAESATSIDTANPIFGGGWLAASVVAGAAAPLTSTTLDFLIPQDFFLKVTMDGEAGITPRYFLASGRKI